MGHYKSNLRDIEFNLFEVLRRQDLLGTGPYRRRRRGDRPRHPRRGEPAGHRPDRRVLRGADRNPPVFDPDTASVRDAGGLQEVVRRASWTPSGSASTCRPSWAASVAPRTPGLGRGRADPGRQPGGLDVLRRPELRPGAVGDRHPGAAAVRRAGHRAQVGHHDGADRAGRRLRRRRRPDQGHRSSPTAPGTSRASSGSSPAPSTTWPRTSSTWCWPAPRGRARHQGPVDVPGAQVPGRPGRRARRAQRRLRHRRRAQDGPEGLHHLRADLRRASTRRSAPGRRACTTASGRCS